MPAIVVTLFVGWIIYCASFMTLLLTASRTAVAGFVLGSSLVCVGLGGSMILIAAH